MNPDTRPPLALVHPLRLLALAALALFALAIGAGPALAATPIDLGAADEGPGLALDANGAAHLSWAADGPTNTALHYCRIDRGGSVCASAKTFPQVGTFVSDFGNAPLLVSGGAVDVLDARFNGAEQKQPWTSANAFASPTVVGSNEVLAGTMEFTQALYAPKGTVSSTADLVGTVLGGPQSNGAIFQATNLTGVATGSAVLSTGSTADATIGRYGPTLVAVYIGLTSGRPIFSRTYTGVGTPASLNNSSNWTPPVSIDAGDNEVALATGSNGPYLAYQGGPQDTLLVRHYNGLGGWEAPVTVAGSHATQISISEDEAGIVHLVWLEPESGDLHYSYGLDKTNSAFSRPQTLEIGEARDTHVATDAAGVGWVTWKEASGDAMAMPVEPGEPPLPPAVTGSGGGGGSQSPPPTPIKASPPVPTPTKSTTAPIVPGLNATLSTPKACVADGAAFKAMVAVKRKGTKAHKLSYSVKQVGFSVGDKLIATDTTKPFEATLHGSARSGASIPIAAKISVVLKKGHRHSTVTKTLTAKVTTCG